MRKIACCGLMLVSLAAFCAPAWAQPSDSAAYLELLRADFKTQKLAIVTDTLALSATEADAFWPVYRQYDAEVTKLGDQRIALVKDYAANFKTMTDAKATELATQSFDLEAKALKLKQDYFGKMSKVVPPATAARFFQIEKQIQAAIDLQVAGNLPLIPKVKPAQKAEN